MAIVDTILSSFEGISRRRDISAASHPLEMIDLDDEAHFCITRASSQR